MAHLTNTTTTAAITTEFNELNTFINFMRMKFNAPIFNKYFIEGSSDAIADIERIVWTYAFEDADIQIAKMMLRKISTNEFIVDENSLYSIGYGYVFIEIVAKAISIFGGHLNPSNHDRSGYRWFKDHPEYDCMDNLRIIFGKKLLYYINF